MSDIITPTIPGAIIEAIKAALADMHTWMPGIVKEYDPLTNRASIQPSIKAKFVREGESFTRSLPVINEVPIILPGSGGNRMKFPIHKGDEVILLFCEASLDVWKTRGGEVDPRDERRHTITDAMAFPGALHKNQDESPIIEFTENQILAGGNAELATKADIDALRTWIAAQFSGPGHVHGVSGSVTNSTTPVSAPGPTPPNANGTQVLKGS